MFRRLIPLVALSVWGAVVLLPSIAYAEVPLNRAVIQSLRNAVQLVLKNQAPRSAKVKDTMAPGDALSTARAALAELRFNDGSLARIGGQALFRFVPKTRTFQLSNGTLLLLVPPGRGQTRIQTPNAVAGIRGSALFVRYLPDRNVTLVGALTESGIEVTNGDRSQTQPLGAGQIAVIVKDRIEQVYRFDLNTFYETSDLVKGLELQRPTTVEQSQISTDPAIAAVRAETSEAVKLQASLGRSDGAIVESSQTPTTDAKIQPNQTPALLDQPTINPGAIALPPTGLLAPPTAALSTTFPPTIALPPTTPLANPPGAIAPTAPSVVLPPGAAPGQIGGIPLQGLPIGQAGNPSGQGVLPPGQAGTAPGQAGTTPGQGGLPPGQAGTAPGLAGTTPGQGGLPPGQAGTAPGPAGTTPGQTP